MTKTNKRANRGARNLRLTSKAYAELAGIKNFQHNLTEAQENILKHLAQIDLKLVSIYLGALSAYHGNFGHELVRMEHSAFSFRSIGAEIARLSIPNSELVETVYDGPKWKRDW